MGNKVTLRHTVTGKVAEYPAHYLNHYGLKDVLVPVEEGTAVDGCTDCGLPERREDCESNPEDCIEAEVDQGTLDKLKNWYNG